MANEKRRKIEQLIDKVFSTLDTTGLNAKKYKDLFAKMNDAQFTTWVKNLVNNDNEFLFLEVLPFKAEPTVNDIEKTAKLLNVPLEEYVYIQNDGDTADPVRTRYKVPVMYLYIKKMQQILSKKNSFSMGIDKRNSKFNQVTDKDKAAKLTEPEVYSLMAIGAEDTIRELFGPRADNDNKDEFYRRLSLDGYVSLNELKNNPSGKSTLNVLNVYLLGMGIKSDIVAPGYIIDVSRTAKEKDVTASRRQQ